MRKKKTWWDELPPSVGGDVIVTEVGAGARDVAIGKNVQQIIQETLGKPGPDDQKFISEELEKLKQELISLKGLTTKQQILAEDRLATLEKELTKSGENPDASIIEETGNWLLDNIPEMAEVLVGFFAHPAIGRIVGRAGRSTIEWAQQRFGNRV